MRKNILKNKKQIDKKLKLTFRVLSIDRMKYLKRTEFENNKLKEIEWTSKVEESMLFGELLIAPMLNYLRKEKGLRVTYESTKLSRYLLARRAHIEHVEKGVKRILREKRLLAKLVDAKNIIGKNEVITNDLRRAINEL